MTGKSSPQSAIRIGTRGSKLARWQADWIAGQLHERGHAVEIVEIPTRGDAESASPIGDIGTGVFTKEIQRALLAGDVDVAVHSLKDLPTEPVDGLTLAAVPPRESAADVLVARTAVSLPTLPPGARIGTGSLRRQAQLRHARPDLRVEGIRGNVDTRLAKFDAGEFDALVLAAAGLNRLGLESRITQVLATQLMLPAVGQGALGIECRADDAVTIASLTAIDDAATHSAVVAERALLAHLRGGCLAPIGALAILVGGKLRLEAVVLSVDGKTRLNAADSALPSDATALGERVAEELFAQGAAELIAESRR